MRFMAASKPKRTLNPRRHTRKHPTPREATLMQWSLYDIGYWSAETIEIEESIHRFRAAPWDTHKIDFQDSALKITFRDVVPTLLIMKLSAAVENALDKLWSIRFPEVDSRRLRHEDKLSVVEKLHRFQATGIRELWKLRNECAHSVERMASRADFDKYFEHVYEFVARFQRPKKV